MYKHRQTRNKLTLIVSVAAVLLSLSYRQTFAGVTVVESTPSRLVLDWELTGFDTIVVPGISGSGKVERRISVYYDGGSVPTGDSAGALIHAYPIHVGVPARGAARFSVESPEVSVLRLSAPLQRRLSRPDSSAPRFASRWVSEPRYGMLRGYRSAHVLLRPVYDAGQGRVQLLKRARITVEFPAYAHTGEVWQPRGEYELMTSRVLLNFKTAQGWHISQGRDGLRKAAAQSDPYPFTVDQKLARFRVGDGNRNLNEGLTNENSLIKIRGAAIRKIFGDAVRISSVALYASRQGEMDVQVPSSPNDIPAGVYEVPMIRYDLNGDGYVDDGDYVVAYVSGASDWGYDKGKRRFGFMLNRYDDYRTYWLTVKNAGSGMVMGRFNQPSVSVAARNVYEANLCLREPQMLSQGGDNHEGGIEWVWKRFTASRADATIQLDLPGIDKSSRGFIDFSIGAVSGSGGTLSAELGYSKLCSNCGNGDTYGIGDWSSRDLIIRYGGSLSSSSGYELKAINVRYSRFLALGGDVGKLEVFSVSDVNEARYRLSNTGSASAYVVRVPAGNGAAELVDIVKTSSYEWSDAGGEGVRYMVMRESDIVDYSDSITSAGDRRYAQYKDYQIRDLRAADNSTDFLIITHTDFLDAAHKLAVHKAGMGFSRPKIVLLGDILDQFGGGNMDPAAIRNFLYYVYGIWDGGNNFSYVTLFGVGHYDYKGASSRAVNFMPVPYINGRFNEDFYVFFDQDSLSSQHSCYYFMGRLPAGSLSEAHDIVEKIRETEDPRLAKFDFWRSRVLLTADDDQQGASVDRTSPTHTASSELISRIIGGGRPDIAQKKIYLFEYGWDERYHKPAATRALINEINSGAAVVNWFGHGSPDQIADEVLLARDNVSALDNRGRYPLFSIFSCSVGKYDQPGGESLAAALVKQPMGGGIAAIASSREVYADRNENLAAPFFSQLFGIADNAELSLGGALARAKIRYTHIDNRYYVLLGDPSIKIIGRGSGIDDLRITDASGERIDTLKALQRVTIKGRVSGVREDDSAYVAITLINPPQDSVRRKDGGKYDTFTVYSLPGSPVFSATRVRVGKNGEFEQPILLPMNLTFGKPGVKLVVYAWNERNAAAGAIGAGYLDGLIFYGSENANLSDSAGPKISVRPVYNSEMMDRAGLFVKNRITTQLPVTLEIKIEDESGINKIGGGPDEGITMEVKGAMSKRSINHLFDFDTGSFKQGKAIVSFEENVLAVGTYDLIISAQDLLGNVSKLSVVWEVTDPSDIKLDHVLNVPNPINMGRPTRFYYTHSNVTGDLDVNVTIRVYSLGGRLLAVIRNPKNGEAWVPRDNKGNYLTPNVYLYQVTATSRNVGRTVKSKIKKLAVLPPN